MAMWRVLAGASALALGSFLYACGGDRSDEREGETFGETSQAVSRLAQARAVCSALDGGALEAGAASPPDAGGADAGAGDAGARAKPGKTPLLDVQPPGLAYARQGAKLVPQFDAPDGVGPKKRPKVELPARADGELVLADPVAQLTVRARLRGAGTAQAALGGDGVLVYPDAFGAGTDVLLRATSEGFEDFVTLPVGSNRSSLVYDVTLSAGVAGLRLVASTLEFLDGSGAPRLRMRAPEIADASCSVRAASVAVEGCAVDSNPAGPWGRPVTPPGKTTCAVRVSWNPSELTLPAVVDPTWTTTATMSGTRGGHEALRLFNGKVLVAGNSNGGAPGNSAELYDPATSTWGTTGWMVHDRYWHQLTQLQDGRVLASGGISLAGVTRNSAEIYTPGTGMWQQTGSMTYARARHASALLAEETFVTNGTAPVIVAGSDANYYYGPPPERFNPVAGTSPTTWTWSVPPGHGASDAMRVSLTRLPSGKLLEAGGAYAYYDDYYGTFVRYPTVQVYLFDPATNAWSWPPASGNLKVARFAHAAAVVSGKVLLAGGDTGGAGTASAELWDPASQTSALTGSMLAARSGPVMVLDNLGAPVIHESGWYASGATERFTGSSWSSWSALPNGGTFYYGRTVRLANGELFSAGVNATSTWNPVAAERLGLACPSPLPAQQACWTAPVCNAGTYLPPVPLTNACCANGAPLAAGATCSDGNPCNGAEVCDGSGGCLVSPTPPAKGTVCTYAPNPCRQESTCDGVSTCVTGDLLPIGASCADGNACNGAEVCSVAGVCQAGTPLPNGTACSAGPGCRSGDRCSAGTCLPGTMTTGGDGNACTTESCNGGGVSSLLAPNACTAIPNLPAAAPNTGMGSSFDFLFTGPGAVQQGKTLELDKSRLAVVRGRVLTANGAAGASGVTVSISAHPEYGTTSTRADGYWDLAVNGGETFTFQFTAADMLTVQRTVRTQAHDWTVLDDVVKTAPLRSVARFTPGSGTFQVVEGQLTPADGDPARKARLYFAPNTLVKDKVGNVRADLTGKALRVDLTEYTVDANGVRRMPGELPPTSGYTYAVGITLRDPTCLTEAPPCTEETLAEVVDPVFSTPASLWLENFINASAGQVPTGSYDRTRAAWVPEPNGSLVNTTPGQQSGLPSDPTELAWATNTANLPAGKYMRVPLAHLSDWDANWGIFPPANPKPPPPPKPEPPPDDPCEASGSIIGCETQSLGEEIPVAGTPYRLRYQSNRTPGYRSKIRITLADASPPAAAAPFNATVIEVTVAGRRHAFRRPAPIANETFTFSWDGLDAYGRTVVGTQRAKVRVGYEYAASQIPNTLSFGLRGGTQVVGNRAARTFTYWSEAEAFVSRFDAKEAYGLGGWTLSDVNRLDLGDALAIEQGAGRRRTLGEPSLVPVGGRVDVLHGFPSTQYVDAVQTADGTTYISFYSEGGILKRAPDGTVSTFVGPGGPLTQTVHPIAMELDRDGNIVFIENRNVWKLTLGATPSITRLAGKLNDQLPPVGDCQGGCGDGVDALDTRFGQLDSMSVGPDGSVFVSDTRLYETVRRITPEGRIETWYQVSGFSPNLATRLSALSDGSVVTRLWGPQTVLKLGADRSVTSVLGKRANGTDRTVKDDVCGEGSQYNYPIVALEDGGLLVGCRYSIVKWSAGKVTRLVGTGVYTPGAPATGAPLQVYVNPVDNMKLTPSRELLFTGPVSLRRVSLRNVARTGAIGLEVPTADGAFLDVFDPGSGRHVQRVHGLTGSLALFYGYTGDGMFADVGDANGNVLVADRSEVGKIKLVAQPGGQTTVLELDANGYLTSVTDANAKTTALSHDASGLLRTFTDARGNVHQFDYDEHGRLVADRDARPNSRGQSLARQDQTSGFDVTLTSAEGRTTVHGMRFDGLQAGDAFPGSNSAKEYRFTKQGSLVTKSYKRSDGTTWVGYPDASEVDSSALLPDPRWGMASPFVSSVTTKHGALTQTRTEERTANLTAAGDPFSLTSAMFRSTLSAAGMTNRVTTRTFTAGSPATWLTSSTAGRQVKTFLDAQERVARIEVGSAPFDIAPIEVTYDGSGRVATVTHGARTWTTTYDPVTGWPSAVTGPGGVATTFVDRDGVGRPKTVLLPGGRTLELRYDDAGNLTQVTPPGGSLHELTFDANNRVASYAPPQVTPALATKDTQYTRDFDGLVTSTNAASLVTSTTFDVLGRAGLSSGNVPRDVQYDGQGRVSSIAAAGVTVTNSQFEGPLVKQVSLGGVLAAPAVLTRTYDNFFQVASWNVTAGGSSPANGITLDYDLDGLPVVAKTPSSTEVLRLTRHAQTGLVLHAQKANGAPGAVWSDATYNLYGELEAFAVSRQSPQSSPYAVAYERDAAGRIIKKTETVIGVTTVFDYHYDAAGRLESETKDGVMTPPWTFDDNGNRLYGTDWKYDAQDRLKERLSGGVTTTYLYTPNGELATKTTGGVSTQYTYDTAGNLKTVALPGGPTLTYVLDGLNRRVGKKRNGVLEQVFVYDGDRIAAELDGTGNVVSRFVYLSQAHSPDLVVKNDGSSYRLVKDHLGSIRLVVNQSTGAIVQQLDYDAWGNTTVVTDGATPFQPFGFAGGLSDRDTNLVRFGARDYDPSTGRWTTKDRSRFGGGWNLFAYAENDPVNRVDPTGHLSGSVAGMVAQAVARAVAPVLGAPLQAVVGGLVVGGSVGLCLFVDCSGSPTGPGTDSSGGPGDAPAPGPAPGGGGSGGGLPSAPPGRDPEFPECKDEPLVPVRCCNETCKKRMDDLTSAGACGIGPRNIPREVAEPECFRRCVNEWLRP